LYSNHQIRESLFAFAQVETDDAEKDRLVNQIAMAEENIDFLDDAATVCRSTLIFATCQQAVNNALSSQNYIDY